MNSPVSILASLLRAAEDGDNLGQLLTRVDGGVDTLITKGASTANANELAAALAAKHGPSYAKARKALSTAVSDPRVLNAVDDARWNELDHAFALGLALGLRMGR